MPLIETEEGADRLARAIISDVNLHHREQIAEHADLTEVLEESRQLFQSRVSSALHPLFERALVDAQLSRANTAATLAPVEKDAPQAPLPPGMFEGNGRAARSRPALWPVLVVLIVATMMGWWLAMR